LTSAPPAAVTADATATPPSPFHVALTHELPPPPPHGCSVLP